MSALADDRLDERTHEALDRLQDDPGFDLEAFVRSHPEHEAELRSRLARLRTQEELLAALRRKPPLHERYEVLQEFGRGGMGRVLAVYDRKLRRTLAMKVLRTPPSEAARGEMGARFLEEARVTGQLDHQGIVPIHDLGLTEEGELYYTMRLIEGPRTLSKVFELAREGQEGWTRMRALDAILRACEAVAYAHQRGVIHRDLKPGNIMVGPLGEVFVVDWGLSRVLETVASGEPAGRPELAALEGARGAEDSPYVTAQGQTLGTPYYMSPEQARGDRDAVDARSDVYSMGAVLYEFLTGRPPYAAESGAASARELVDRIVAGPPRPIADAAPGEPSELVAICGKALQRQPADRYPSITELAEDLRAFTEGRVVAAYETGAWAEARKWVGRNKLLAASLAAVVLAVLAGGVAFALEAQEATEAATLAQSKEAEAKAQQLRAEEGERLAREETAKVLRLSDVKVLQELEAEADLLWPAHPAWIPGLESWLARARELAGRLPGHLDTLAEMRTRGHAWSEDERRVGLGPEVLAWTEEVGSRQEWSLDTAEEQWQHDVLAELVGSLKGLESGLLAEDAVTPDHGWSVPKRLDFARELEAGFAQGGRYAEAWAEALPAIHERYPGLELTPQLGLLPLGPDPDSGLWEFAHLMTGTPAERGADDKLKLTEETGVVLVLLPGGSFWMGAQSEDPDGQNYDPMSRRGVRAVEEGPVHEVELSAFFLSKYEMTQGQWLRLTGRNPSSYRPDSWLAESLAWTSNGSLVHPVERVSWLDCVEWLRRAGLELPSEEQWEYGARAGTQTPWWTGAEKESLSGAANLIDRYAQEQRPAGWEGYEPWLDDGALVHAEVGSYSSNAFGLHDVAGNVGEWCLDGNDGKPYDANPGRDPVVPWEGTRARMTRGGDFSRGSLMARSAGRFPTTPIQAVSNLGVRPARAIER